MAPLTRVVRMIIDESLYRMHNEVRINSNYCLENVIKKGKKRLKNTLLLNVLYFG